MKSSIAAVMLLASISVSVAAERVCPRALPLPVEAKLLPVLSALSYARQHQIAWDKRYERRFNKLLGAKDKASAQARVALMDYYVGEAYGEQLVCAVAFDGARAADLIELYEECDIQPTHSPMPRNHGSPLRGYSLKIIRDGTAKESCTFE